MGFDAARVDWAIKATGGRGLQSAMDHIIENEGKSVPDLSSVSAGAGAAASSSSAPGDEDDEDIAALKAVYGHKGGIEAQTAAAAADNEAKSIKCTQCGKVFRNTALAQYHAEKSGHDQFEESTEEIKPLTEEEKKQKLEDLRAKMAVKRAAKAKEDEKEARANEAIRRKSGKDINEIREELKQKEILKEAEAKRRGLWHQSFTQCFEFTQHYQRSEKIEDAKARAAIKAQIEADKKARHEKAAREKALREGREIVDSSAGAPSTNPSAITSATSGLAGRDYPQTRLQIRMASGGQPYTTTLPSDSTLREVAEFLAGQTLLVDVETVSFAQHFPRKQFSQADFSRTLRDLGLTPSAVLIAS
ncbi:hypothetical protein NM688_g7477 [Phlebia brevispora]|uniref:Uncharacterized protein n=1 Tax=Phlebia brevispora TaxID=194682 RepID=A0ACC1S4P5_9APHY|nr:hypothetical protein NM688_g7477 [Phlebia brevispora]